MPDSASIPAARRTTGLADRAVQRWLVSLWLLIALMVMVGGTTRLTGSGLSMVEWRPLMGAVPPLDEAQWQEVFDKYKRTPQYQQVNHWMQLGDFKRIFFWEYVHRLLGRLIGVAFAVPFVYFLWRRRLRGADALRVSIAFVLGGLQGLLGWYMVQSGLSQMPRVSHFRLAAHLVLAFAVGQWVVWLLCEGCARARGEAPRALDRHSRHSRRLAAGLLWLFALQVVYGAFMAGTRAGYYYSTFPDMHGHYLPGRFFTGTVGDFFHNPSAIHYIHRALGWLCVMCAIGLYVYLRKAESRRRVVRAAAIVCGLAFLQFNLGALAVVQRVDLPIAVAHQGMAFLLVTGVTVLVYRARYA